MAGSICKTAREYRDQMSKLIETLDCDAIDALADLVFQAWEHDRQVFVFGNGGSAATASHMMNDLNKGTLGHKGDAPWKRFKVIALTDNVSLMTAWANDTDYNTVFSEPLKNLANRGDVLIAISASGNSPNIVAAIEVAKQMGLTVLGLGGFTGGKLAQLADACVVVPSNGYGPVEDVHMILDHILTGYLYEKLKAAHAK